VNKSQAGAIVWLQSAADYLAKTTFESCAGGVDVQQRYNDQLDAAAAPKSQNGWPNTTGINVSQPVQYWDNATSTFSATCVPTTKLEQITLQVKSPSGSYSHSLVIVKSNG